MEPLRPHLDPPATASLPSPATERWQPLRCGLLNLYRYDEQEFRFQSGRLLLRGNNGTGKSRVLALQLPFLFDGEIRPERVEPDGDPAKRMEWNLLLGKYPDRLGYTWIEFGRTEGDGVPRFLTLGCGLQAARGRGVHNRWFFITTARIGHDLYLQSASGQPLTRSRLAEMLEGRGQVLTTAEAYRRAIDRELFHLGEHRYMALVNLLIQLRQPQLSRKLDERKLSDALGEALAPLSQVILADVGEAMRGLEHERNELAALRAAGDGVQTFVKGYRRYAQIAARRRARDVRRHHADYEEAMRRLRDAERRCDAARLALKKTESELDALAVHARGLEAEIETLTGSPEMHRARELDRARRELEERTSELQQAGEEREGAEQRHRELLAKKRDDDDLATQALQSVQSESANASKLAEPVGLAPEHNDAVALLDLPAQTDVDQVAAASELLEEAATKREEAARRLRAVNRDLDAAEQRLTLARREQDRRESALTEARERHQAATDALETSVDAHLEAYESWRRATGPDFDPPDTEAVEPDLRVWSEGAEGPNPIRIAVQDAERELTRRLERSRAALRQRLETLAAEREELEGSLARFESGYEEPPPAPHTRDSELRTSRPGAPLWRVCDFAPGLGERERAGLEAALEASGMLDAWVTPDGLLIDPDDHDHVLVALDAPRPAGRHLGEWIRPLGDTDSSVQPDVVARLLAQIGRKDDGSPVWVSPSGRWQVGPLRGAWSKREAQYIGPDARARHRERRCAELREALRSLDERGRELHDERRSIERRADAVRKSVESLPSDDTIVRAGADLRASRRHADECGQRVREAEAETIERRTERDRKRDDRDRLAADLHLDGWPEDLDGFAEALNRYRVSLAQLWPAIREQVRARALAERTAAQASEVARQRERWSRRERDARGKAEAAEARRNALQEAAGAGVGEILARVERARAELKRSQEKRDALSDDKLQLRVDEHGALKDAQNEKDALEECDKARAAAIDRMRRYVETGLMPVAVAELDAGAHETWSITRAVDVSRRLEDALRDIASDDPDWERIQNACRLQFEELQQALRAHDYQPAMRIEDDLWLVTVPFRGRERNVAELHRELDDEIVRHQEILSHREKEIIQNHLIGEVAHHLHERIREGEELVREMNAELESRPMSTGMRLRFSWRPVDDGPAGLPEARKRLLAASSTWSEADRESLGSFLQEQIQRVREANLTGTWQEHLTEALDYRRWHRFGIERQQDGRWQRLTRRTHGTGSGGEKAIALTIPQFAAAAAHYRTADPRAPRLILLDEAFVGVDSDMRSKCMGLLKAFDLDFVMTSEREWGCYATLPGLAIYQLSTRPGIDAVGVTRWVWNGRERVQDAAAAPSMRAPRDDEDRALEVSGAS